ncbi:hypothetical protein ACJIZ3_018255 [Penstemon smallii]|uniref:DRBM domain-containing protein n=1 Tax=Penstemon smallii TaxID=265156 RepID=A0ABD3SZ14_9LAMI
MYKNQLQELAQRSCFNLPSYSSTREGPDHAPRFKASVNFNGEIFDSPTYSTTLRQAEHAAAEVALNSLSAKGPSKSLTARVLDETGVYKNLLQETAHRAGLKLPVYITIRSGPGHVPVFTSTVELAGMNFTGESAKTKKQAEKNAAISAWSSLKKMPNLGYFSKETEHNETEQDHVIVGRVLSSIGRSRNESRVIRRRDQYQPRRRNNQQWKYFSDSSLECSRTKQSTSSSFLSLLPPPPPRTFSKILPPNLSKDDQNQRVESELEVKGFSNSSSLFYGIYKPFPDQTAENSRTQIVIPQLSRSMISGVHHTQRIAPAVQIRSVIPVCAAPPVILRRPSSIEEASSAELASTLSKLKL